MAKAEFSLVVYVALSMVDRLPRTIEYEKSYIPTICSMAIELNKLLATHSECDKSSLESIFFIVFLKSLIAENGMHGPEPLQPGCQGRCGR